MGKAAKAGAKKSLPKAPLGEKKAKAKKNPLFEKTPRNFRLGGDIQPKRNLNRFVRWPKFVKLQRMKRVMLMRLKVPPAINQFNMTIDKNQAAQLFKLMKKYMPETAEEKKARLMEMAQQKKDGQEVKTKKPTVIKYGLNHVTTLIEQKQAKLVAIAHDVDPLELVMWLPALCRKKEVPYCIVKGKGRLGQLVHKKSAAVVALTTVGNEDKKDLDTLATNFMAQFNDNAETRRRWGGGIMGIKSQHVMQRREKAIQIEQAKKLGLQIA
jgi:large subunit ribosomal protein L7Ae